MNAKIDHPTAAVVDKKFTKIATTNVTVNML